MLDSADQGDTAPGVVYGFKCLEEETSRGRRAGSQLASILRDQRVHFIEPAVSWSWMLCGMFGGKVLELQHMYHWERILPFPEAAA